jgi:hypothetical protein
MTDDQNELNLCDEALAEYWDRYDTLFNAFGPVMPNDRRLKDCTDAEMVALECAWNKGTVRLNKLWDEAAADSGLKQYEYDNVPDIVFRILFGALLSLAEDKGADKRSVMDLHLLLRAALTFHSSKPS